MSVSSMGARRRRKTASLAEAASVGPAAAPMVLSTNGSKSGTAADYSFVDLGDSARVALMLTPWGRGALAEQAGEVLGAMDAVLARQAHPMAVTLQTVFLRTASDQAECERLLAARYGKRLPVTNYVLQPPCCGAALAIEAWAIGGPGVRVEHFGPRVLAVSYDSVRWVYAAGFTPAGREGGVYRRTLDTLDGMKAGLLAAGSSFEHVVRTWFYLGGITEMEGSAQRYQEFNRARAQFYHGIPFCSALLEEGIAPGHYPASTGIGAAGDSLVASCITLQTDRPDARLLPLENPRQTPAYAYHPKYSPESPKFSRATALVLDDYLTTWISGTASIVNSESRHPGDIRRQTEQTIDNIERLIAPENCAGHGLDGAGAALSDLAKLRVYLKRPEDFAACKAVCDRRFGPVPAIYAVADVCRPELLVEIEGVAFSRLRRGRR